MLPIMYPKTEAPTSSTKIVMRDSCHDFGVTSP